MVNGECELNHLNLQKLKQNKEEIKWPNRFKKQISNP